MAIKAVLFDLDDTLLWDERSVQEAFDATCAYGAARAGVDARELEAAVRREARALYESYPTFGFTKMIGINPFEGLWAHFKEGEQEQFRQLEQLAPQYRLHSWTNGLRSLGVEDAALAAELAERFPQERRSRPLVYEETFAVLDQLKGKYQLLLLTNGSPDLQQEKLAGVPEIAPYFDHILISGNFGIGKPDEGIFRHAMELLGIEAAEGVMVGDKLTTDIAGSNSVGMASVWVNRHGHELTGDTIPDFEIRSLTDLLELLELQEAVE